MESFMVGYDDPRLPFYATPAGDPAFLGQYKGIRNGIDISSASYAGNYGNFSQITSFPNAIVLMTTAEAYFLKAEAAIRNWAGAGDAKTNYEAGIQASFDMCDKYYGSTISAQATNYIADGASTPIPYVDPKNSDNDVNAADPHLSTITIKWDDSADFNTKLERIITQKWLALYPEGQEAWSEFRRTTYPKLFPVVINNSQGTIATEKFIRRLVYPSSEYSNNPQGVAKAVTLLGGTDSGGTPLWWDKN
ncbi:MAG: SusD/RagB family nutrient-binding outer membrane lipoprotein [Cyclobacteriaceae bacterium]